MILTITHQYYFLQGGLESESWAISVNGQPRCVFYSKGELEVFLKNAI